LIKPEAVCQNSQTGEKEKKVDEPSK